MSELITVMVRRTEVNCSIWEGAKEKDFLDHYEKSPFDAKSAWKIVQAKIKSVRDAQAKAAKQSKEDEAHSKLVGSKAFNAENGIVIKKKAKKAKKD